MFVSSSNPTLGHVQAGSPDQTYNTEEVQEHQPGSAADLYEGEQSCTLVPFSVIQDKRSIESQKKSRNFKYPWPSCFHLVKHSKNTFYILKDW